MYSLLAASSKPCTVHCQIRVDMSSGLQIKAAVCLLYLSNNSWWKVNWEQACLKSSIDCNNWLTKWRLKNCDGCPQWLKSGRKLSSVENWVISLRWGFGSACDALKQSTSLLLWMSFIMFYEIQCGPTWQHLPDLAGGGWWAVLKMQEEDCKRGSGNLALSHPKLACQYWLHLWKENSDRCEMPAYLTLIWALHSDKISLIKVTQPACFKVQLLWSSCCVLVSPRVNEL